MTLLFRVLIIVSFIYFNSKTVYCQSFLYPNHYYNNGIFASMQWFPQLKGTNLNIVIRDDKIDTSILDLKNKVAFQENSSLQSSTHSTKLACLVAGSGITGNYPKGIATASSLFNTSSLNLLPDERRIKEWKASVHLFSYGTEIENYYGLEAALYDAAALNDTSLVYIFSSGNAGSSKAVGGRFDQLVGWSNLTGNFKQSKNSIVVGATNENNSLFSFSSRGPTYDGRIKPEITAYSDNGTSESAAVVAGSVLIIQDSYKEKFGRLPSSAFIRSAILSASNKPNGNLSYESGFGHLDLLNTLKIIEREQFIYGSVASLDSFLCRIKIPFASKNLTITISWLDPPAQTGAPKALVNDLDISCTNSIHQRTYLPNVLSLQPNPTMLKLNSTQGIDNLNNNEQIFIEKPLDSILQIRVKAKLTQGVKQSFYITYSFDDSASLEWITPVQSQLSYDTAGVFLSWKSDPKETSDLFFEDENGIIRLISLQFQGNKFFWKPAKPIPRKLRFLLKQGNNEIASPWVSLYARPNIKIVSVCKDSLYLEWDLLDKGTVAWIGDITKLPFKPLSTYVGIKNNFMWVSMKDYQEHPLWLVSTVNDSFHVNSSVISTNLDLGSGCLTETFSASPGLNKISLALKLSTATSIDSIEIQKKHFGIWEKIYSSIHPASNIYIEDLNPVQGTNFYRLIIYAKNKSPLYAADAEAFFFTKKSDVFYPNPIISGSTLRFAFKDPAKRYITLLDVRGRILKSFYTESSFDNLSIPLLSSGTYFIRVNNGKEVRTETLLVN